MLDKRLLKDRIAGKVMVSLTVTSVFFVVGIGVGLFIKSLPVLNAYSLKDLLLSGSWHPMKGEFGFFPFIMGTIWVTALSLILAFPISILTAVYLTEFSSNKLKHYVFPALDILASLPSVIYGVWGTLLIVPWISKHFAPLFGTYSSGYTVLAGGIVLAIMILPLMVSLFIELFTTVSQELRDSSISLGATKWQTVKCVVIRQVSPGIIAIIGLAVSRALGETIAILMVCGNLPQIPHSLFDACYPLPALIANNYGEMLSLPLYESSLMFAALLLFFVVLLFNLISRMALRRFNANN